MQGNTVQFTGQMSEQMLPHKSANNSPSQVMGMQGQVWQPSGPGTCGPSSYMAQQHGDPASTANNMSACLKWCLLLASSKPTWSTHLFLPPTHTCRPGRETAPWKNHFSGYGVPFNAPFPGAPNGIRCPGIRIQVSQ